MSASEPPRRFSPALLAALLVSLAVRLWYIAILPAYAYSYDISCWEDITEFIGSGTNPYMTTVFLSWPPLWMICLFLMDRIAELGSLQFIQVLRAFLLVVESIGIILAWMLAKRVAPSVSAERMLLFGLALNPIAILLTCQHGNFDSLVAVWVMATVLAIVAHQRSRDPVDWLMACFFLGMGVLTKTVPIALTPLLIAGARGVKGKARLLGATLLLGPSALGLGVLFALQPQSVIDRVFLYTSFPGRFGFSGLAKSFGMTDLLNLWGPISSLALLALLAWGCVKAWSWSDMRDHHAVLLAGLILLAIPTIGPGFGPQYAFWFLPLLAVSYLSGSARYRAALLAAYAVSALTYVGYYALARDLGQPLVYLSTSATVRSLGELVTREEPRVWLTLPMFVSWLVLLVVGIRELRGPVAAAGEPSDSAA
ncbi:MAG: hypothetical protein ACSLFQ_23130 [Thermoanaerobaculia bacterium]